MAITSTYQVSETDGTLVETTGGMMDPVLNVIKAPVDVFSTAANDTYVTKRAQALTSLISMGVAGVLGLGYQAYRVNNGKQPVFAGLLS